MRDSFYLEIAAADTGRRLIEGVGLPFNTPAPLGFATYRFRPGSIRLARTSTPLLLGHDKNAPAGVLTELEQGSDIARMRFRVDRTPDGDRALVQARSGSRSGLSIGFEVDRSTIGADGVVDVDEASVYEVSLVSVPAFEDARVTRVAAQRAGELEPEPAHEDGNQDEDDEDELDEDELEHEDGDESTEQEESAMPAEQETLDTGTAERRPAMLIAERRRLPELGAGEFVRHLIGAQHGDREAAALLTAALTESISTDVSGLLPPTYERTVIGGKQVSRVLYETFRSRPLPGVGLMVSKPKWTTPPNGAWAATVDADATSTQVAIGAQTADVARWDWAGAIPWVVVQRSDPSIVDEIYSEAVQDWYIDVEAKIYGELAAAAPGVATTLGAAVAEFYTASGNQRSPDVIIMAPDVWGRFADTGALSVSLAQGPVDGDPLATSFAGIRAITSGTLAAGETILATRRAVDARVTEPVRLTANAIGALNVELAVVGEGLFDTDYPGELLKFAAIVPAAAGTTGTGARKS
jgi:HK97 family phage prohead protease